MEISAQVSLYPLGQEPIGPPVEEAVALFRERGLLVEAGRMSTVLAGDDERVFDGVRDALRRASEAGEVVLVATFSNACPVAPSTSV